MTKVLLSLHVLVAIVAIGPITVAASMFPRYAKPPAPEGGPVRGDGDDHDLRTAAFLHKICRAYTSVGIAVPVLGIATGAVMGVLGDAWLIASIVLTGVAAGVLLALVLPGQEELLEEPDAEPVAEPDADAEKGTESGTGAGTATDVTTRRAAATRLAMTTGIFNLLWGVVVVLMIVRPGSTTGA
ncbi:hypothetical protein ACH4SP_14450 [Streptomyces sp. NPDC021093]|uniref:hypothetical protein n=1 Tax=Streptomyces sp. NPDC021093 TaxID=3365112 RepID=UPI0037985173